MFFTQSRVLQITSEINYEYLSADAFADFRLLFWQSKNFDYITPPFAQNFFYSAMELFLQAI
jgi:hypothetical protein